MNSWPRCRIVIPARLASTRLPEKLLLRETGRSVLEHTYRSASEAVFPESVIVAVDHERLFQEVQAFGGQAQMTNRLAQCGTERVAEVAACHPDIDVWINVQGDEPEIEPNAIDQLYRLMFDNPAASLATLATPIRDRERLDDPNCVKVVCDRQQRAMYFSRSPIPHARSWNDGLLDCEPPLFLQHLGIYAYRREVLAKLHQIPSSRLEETEKLEQLRFLEAGYSIVVGQVASAPRGIDTRSDYDAFVARYLALAGT